MRRNRFGRTLRVLAGGIVLVIAAPAQAGPARPAATPGPEGQIAFASDRDGDAEIFVMDADGSNLRQITDNYADDHSPDWAPDGRRIVFVHQYARQENADIHIVDTVTGEETVLTGWRYWYETDPVWSPDGNWIAFSSEHPDGDGGDVIALSVDGERSRPIAIQQENSTNVDPTWSPDGKRLAFVERDAADLFTTSFCCNHGYRRRTVTRDPLVEWHPDWSPDGSRILLSRSAGGHKHGLYTISPEGRDLRPVFEGPLDARSGTWSPDGSAIAFYAKAGVGYDIYRIDADGTGLMRLTDHAGSDQHPDWSPVPSA